MALDREESDDKDRIFVNCTNKEAAYKKIHELEGGEGKDKKRRGYSYW